MRIAIDLTKEELSYGICLILIVGCSFWTADQVVKRSDEAMTFPTLFEIAGILAGGAH